MFEARCANPSCHGRPDRPFAVYAPRRWRLDPRRTFVDEPLTPEEEARNFEVAVALATEAPSPETSVLLTKPLESVAGTYHGGGAIFEGTTDRDYWAVRQWLETGRGPP